MTRTPNITNENSNWDWLEKLEPLSDGAIAAINEPVLQQDRPALEDL